MSTSRRTAGFSLLEVMCAVLILGVGIAGLTQGVATALRSSQESERETRAALIAAGRVETLRAEGLLLEGELEGAGSQDLAVYRWLESIQETDLEGLYEVVVTVRHGASDTPVYELRTLLFDPPLTRSATNEQTEVLGTRISTRGSGR